MRLLVVAGLGAAAAALSLPALADNVTYLGLRGSYAVTEDSDVAATGFAGDISFDQSFGGSIAIGKFLGPDVRIEAELMYMHSDADNLRVTQDTVNLVPLTGQSFGLAGDIDLIAPVFNLILELPIEGTSVDLYYGGGVGGAHIDVKASSAAAGLAIDDDAWALAYQLMVGATAPLGEGIEGLVGYRFFSTTDFSADDPVLGDFDMKLRSHQIELGLLFRL